MTMSKGIERVIKYMNMFDPYGRFELLRNFFKMTDDGGETAAYSLISRICKAIKSFGESIPVQFKIHIAHRHYTIIE